MAGLLSCFHRTVEAEYFLRDDWTCGITLIELEKLVFGRSASYLIQRNSTPAIESHHAWAAERRGVRYQPAEGTAEGHMTVAQQAFLFTGEIFVLSFAAIYAMWFVDRLLRNFRR